MPEVVLDSLSPECHNEPGKKSKRLQNRMDLSGKIRKQQNRSESNDHKAP